MAKPTRLTPAQRARLRLVKVPERAVDLRAFPDFLIVGPQRTGTTWLHQNLARHPQLLLSEPKETFYFSSIQWPDAHPPELPPISVELEWYLRFFQETPEAVARKRAACRARFGERYRPQARGEASATYAVACQRAVIDEILVLNPEIKAILLVRHPYERAWSHIKKEYHMDGGRPVDAITAADCERFFADPYRADCSRFSPIVERWQAALRPGHLFVGDFRDIAARPADLLRRLFGFLGVRDRPEYVGEDAGAPLCVTPREPIPSPLLPLLEALYGDELTRLRAHGFAWD